MGELEDGVREEVDKRVAPHVRKQSYSQFHVQHIRLNSLIMSNKGERASKTRFQMGPFIEKL